MATTAPLCKEKKKKATKTESLATEAEENFNGKRPREKQTKDKKKERKAKSEKLSNGSGADKPTEKKKKKKKARMEPVPEENSVPKGSENSAKERKQSTPKKSPENGEDHRIAEEQKKKKQKKQRRVKHENGSEQANGKTDNGHVSAGQREPTKTKKEKKNKKKEKAAKDQANGGKTATPTTSDEKQSKKEQRKKGKKDRKQGKNSNRKRPLDESCQTQEAPPAKKARQAEPASCSSASATPRPSAPPATFSAAAVAYASLHNVTVTPADFPPVLSFADAPFPNEIMAASCANFKAPTPIQAYAWPAQAAGRDVVGIASTGSGKTLAFALPALFKISRTPRNRRPKKPSVLVLAPTRELAQQSGEVFSSAGAQIGARSICVYGGVPKAPQSAALRSGVDVVIGCPGRIIDLVNDGLCDLSGVDFVVLDEADRMLDLGFADDIATLIGYTLPTRQTLMFSATWPQAIRTLAAKYLSSRNGEWVRITVGSDELAASSTVTQHVEVLDMRQRDQRLLQLLNKYHSGSNRVLIFVLYKKEAPRLSSFLQAKGWNNTCISGDLPQARRQEAVDRFRTGQDPLLIATDVAARGLDIPDVEYVINYSFPLTIEDYVHRIGRTGRAGKSGVAHTFFTIGDKPRAGDLVGVLREGKHHVPEELLAMGPSRKKVDPVWGEYGPREDAHLLPPPRLVVYDD
eukprot:gnl/Spiro4/23130_TR11441_c0_g1_i1.p1 gnl/Spiro4/23130_TR11441_c0_g1~~gnl/Spiro4/23130_TR11441_c0_g1_i1.p1  ORF type:complete len:702 (+),score=183.91 gnl/Spiro4/23130_TR11441_c0_g1_i1:38-2107(+)